MPDRNRRTPKNVPGKFYVDDQCLAHEMCHYLAPQNFAYDAENGCYYVCKQPETRQELAQCLKAVSTCPMAAIGTDGDDTQPQILSPEDSALWRQAYINAFVDTSREHFQRYIASPRQFSDGDHYEGYLWDCLRLPSRITVQRFRHEVVRHPEVFVMADDHSRDRIPGAPLWPYRPYSVARFQPQMLLQSLDSLPEDIYVFDSSVSWTLVLTHEYDGKRRIGCSVGIEI